MRRFDHPQACLEQAHFRRMHETLVAGADGKHSHMPALKDNGLGLAEAAACLGSVHRNDEAVHVALDDLGLARNGLLHAPLAHELGHHCRRPVPHACHIRHAGAGCSLESHQQLWMPNYQSRQPCTSACPCSNLHASQRLCVSLMECPSKTSGAGLQHLSITCLWPAPRHGERGQGCMPEVAGGPPQIGPAGGADGLNVIHQQRSLLVILKARALRAPSTRACISLIFPLQHLPGTGTLRRAVPPREAAPRRSPHKD